MTDNVGAPFEPRAMDLPLHRSDRGGASFSLAQRLHRMLWRITWALLAAWTPPPFSPWRIFLLKLFGARIHPGAAIAASTDVWLPRNLELGPGAALGPGVDCYNMAPIRIGARSIVSQRTFLCAGTHDISDRGFPLKVRPIEIGDDVWLASESFVGPGVKIANGTVIGARGCVFEDTKPWTVYRGNPAVPIKARQWREPASLMQKDALARPIRVLKINCVMGPFLPMPPTQGGAVERIFLNLCEVFAAMGHEVTIVSRRSGKLPYEEWLNGVRHLRVPSYDSPSSMLVYRILDLIYAARVCLMLPVADVTLTHSVALPLIIPRRRAGLIYMSIGRFPKGQMGVYRRVDRMQTVSTHVGAAIRAQSPGVAPLVKTVPNAISRTFAEAISDDRGLRSKEIIFVGRIAREKGIDLLVRAFLLVHPSHPDWKLTIVGPHLPSQGGDGEACLADLMTLSAPLGDAVSFTGPVFDEKALVAHFKRCEIFVYPSIAAKGEALPMAPIEAMACGCATVVSSLDCFLDYLRDGKNGVAFDESDASGTDLAEKLRTLMSDDAGRDSLGQAGAQTARGYAREAVADLFIDDFRSLLAARDDAARI